MAENTYVNISPEDFDAETQEMYQVEKQMYAAIKAHRAKLTERIKAQLPDMPVGKEIKSTTHTRWGQWQLVIGDKAVVKAAGNRPTLADFLAQQQASGYRS